MEFNKIKNRFCRLPSANLFKGAQTKASGLAGYKIFCYIIRITKRYQYHSHSQLLIGLSTFLELTCLLPHSNQQIKMCRHHYCEDELISYYNYVLTCYQHRTML